MRAYNKVFLTFHPDAFLLVAFDKFESIACEYEGVRMPVSILRLYRYGTRGRL